MARKSACRIRASRRQVPASSQPRNDRGHDGHSTKAERGSPPPCIPLHDGYHQFVIRENTYDETLLEVGSQFAGSPLLETVPQSIELSSN